MPPPPHRPKNTASSFETTDEKWQDDAKDKKAMRFHSLVHFVGAYPHTDAKGGGELVHSTSLESEAAAWISMTSPQFWFRKKVLPGQADKRCRYSEIAVRRGLRMLIYFHCLIFAFVFQLIKNEATNPGTIVTPEKTACFCLSNNPDQLTGAGCYFSVFWKLLKVDFIKAGTLDFSLFDNSFDCWRRRRIFIWTHIMQCTTHYWYSAFNSSRGSGWQCGCTRGTRS